MYFFDDPDSIFFLFGSCFERLGDCRGIPDVPEHFWVAWRTLAMRGRVGGDPAGPHDTPQPPTDPSRPRQPGQALVTHPADSVLVIYSLEASK